MSYISWWSPGWVARPLLLSLLSIRKSQQAATHLEQANKQANKQTNRQGSPAEPPTPSHPGTKIRRSAPPRSDIMTLISNLNH